MGLRRASVLSSDHFVYIDFKVTIFYEIVKGVLAESVIEYPEIADVAYVLAQGTIIFRLSHIQVGDAGIAFAEPVHCQLVSF
jgi:hypothetical protein